MVAIVLAQALLERFGGDSIRQLRLHVGAEAERVAGRVRRRARPAGALDSPA
jgi:hypothetical protein